MVNNYGAPFSLLAGESLNYKRILRNTIVNNAKKLAFFLPNSFTALNLACGFGCIILSIGDNTYFAAFLLILGGIFDSVDGRVARLTGTQSQFGEQFDSISDVISFGVAPAIMMYQEFLQNFGRLGQMVAFFYLLCGALRLARFNANIEKVTSDYFQGLPIPAAALAMVGQILLSYEYPFFKENGYFAPTLMVFYGIMMVSNIPFFSFKNTKWAKEHKKRTLALLFLTSCLIYVFPEIMIAAIIFLYSITSVVRWLVKGGSMEEIFLWKNDSDVDVENH